MDGNPKGSKDVTKKKSQAPDPPTKSRDIVLI